MNWKIASVWCVLLACGCGESSAAGAPRLSVANPALDLTGSAIDEVEIHCDNVGGVPIELMVDPPGCSCLSVDGGMRMVPTGGRVSIPVRVAFGKVVSKRTESLTLRYRSLGTQESFRSASVTLTVEAATGIATRPHHLEYVVRRGDLVEDAFDVFVRCAKQDSPRLDCETLGGVELGCSFVLELREVSPTAEGQILRYSASIVAAPEGGRRAGVWRFRWRFQGVVELTKDQSCVVRVVD